MRGESEEGEPGAKKPIRGSFLGCSASAGKLGARSRKRTKTMILLLIEFYPSFWLTHDF
jgi:hypothetical protein